MPLSTPQPKPGPVPDSPDHLRQPRGEGVFLRFLQRLRTSALPAKELPEPFRDLLAHDRDMTSTLTRHHREHLVLRVLEQEVSAGWLERRVHLLGSETRRVVEVGAIRIQLALFPDQAQRQIREGLCPLGAVLAEHRIAYRSRPQGFFRVQSVEDLSLGPHLSARDSGAPSSSPAYGRHNSLLNPAEEVLAEVLEVLPS